MGSFFISKKADKENLLRLFSAGHSEPLQKMSLISNNNTKLGTFPFSFGAEEGIQKIII
jgi:hypothetical protein